MQEKPEKQLIRETVKDRLTGKALVRKLLLTVGLALVFGVVASLTFVLTRPIWEGDASEPATSEPITIFDDTSEAADPGSEPATEPPAESTAADEPSSEAENDLWLSLSPHVYEAVNNGIAQITEKDALYAARRRVVDRAAVSIVNVTTQSEEDWLDRSVIARQESFGVIAAVTDTEVLMLVPLGEVESADNVYATFAGKQVQLAVTGTDSVLGIAAASVPLDLIPAEFGSPVPIEMGISSYIQQGSAVIAMGSPLGLPGSVVYGVASFIDVSAPAADGIVRIIQTDMPAVSGGDGILLDFEGRMVGWLTSDFSDSTVPGCIAAISLADLRTPIEIISNGGSVAALGIRGQTVPQSVVENGTPAGVYVTEPISGQSADAAGVLGGDVITALDGESVSNFPALTKLIMSHAPGDEVALTIMRVSRGEWQEVSLTAQLGGR